MNEVDLLLEKAGENISASELLLSKGYYRVSVSRSYYAMFYTTEAILQTKNLSYSSHREVISNFSREFVKTGLFEPKFHQGLRDAFKSRQDADYEPVVEFSEEEARQHLGLAKEFLEAAKEYLKK